MKDLDWVVHLVLGDCMHFFEQKDWDNFKYFRNELSLLKARQKEVQNYEESNQYMASEQG